MELTVTDTPPPHAREVIARGLSGFNAERAGPGGWRPLSVLIAEPGGEVTGGLWGATFYGWLFVEMLFVPEALRGRGLGAEVLERGEAEARARGCRGAWLDTFAFQARAFYEGRGYRLFGEIPDHPPGSARYFLLKQF